VSSPLPPEVRNLLDCPNFAHLATVRKDGSPQVDPVWIAREGDLLLIGTGERTRKARNARRDPRVSVSIVDFDDPYEEAILQGRVIEHRPDGDLRVMDAISRKYTGKEFPWRNPQGRIVLVIEVSAASFRKLPFEHTPVRS
jgi:PPOX class probable F420-dependent enzyme